MKVRTVVLLIALLLLALFVIVNWTAFTAPVSLSLLVTRVEAPLGLLMLFITALLVAGLLVYIAMQQAGVLLETRRYAKDLQAQRELADHAEVSRFTELRAWMEQQLTQRQARIDALEVSVNQRLTEQANSLAAVLGEIEDKLDRVLAQRG
jgi:uncharacterized integral membrane protein